MHYLLTWRRLTTSNASPSDVWRIAAVLVLVVAVHHGIWAIPFQYSEVAGIKQNRTVTNPRTFAARMLTPNGLLQRPLSVFSYMLDYAIYDGHPAGFHLTNLVIHCVNTLLVFALARDFFAAPVVAALVFGLHPLATACVSQIFGRNYSLATMFVLLAFYLYLRWRSLPSRGHIATLVALFLLAVLAKQSAVVLPALLLWYEIGRRGAGARELGALLASPRARLAAAGSLLIAITLVVLYAAPLSATATIDPLTYLVSQIANAPVLASFYLLPYQTALVHDLYLYRNAAYPEVWLGVVSVATLVYASWRWRAHPAGWLVGAMLICLIPTNSVLPKNELVREWRLYPSLPFFALLVAHGAAAVARRTRAAQTPAVRYAPHLVLALYLATFAHSDVRQNTHYRSAVTAWRQVLARYPYSTDAMNALAIYEYADRDYETARTLLREAVTRAPDVWLYRVNLARAYTALGDTAGAEHETAEATRVAERYGRRMMASHFR